MKDEETVVATGVGEKKQHENGSIDAVLKDERKKPPKAHHECITLKDLKTAGAAKKHEKKEQRHGGPDTPTAVKIIMREVKPQGADPEAKPEVRVVNEAIGEKAQSKTTSASKTENKNQAPTTQAFLFFLS